MKDIDRLLKNVINLDLNDVFFSMWRRNDVQDYIISLNTRGEPTSQLFEFGENSKGNSIGEYSPFTKNIKQAQGQPTNRITLFDTGEFYGTFKVTPFKEGFRITANPVKDDDNLFDDFGVDIVGLSKENILLLLDFIQPMFSKELNERLFA